MTRARIDALHRTQRRRRVRLLAAHLDEHDTYRDWRRRDAIRRLAARLAVLRAAGY